MSRNAVPPLVCSAKKGGLVHCVFGTVSLDCHWNNLPFYGGFPGPVSADCD